MDVSRDTAFQLRLGAPEDMLVRFDGLKRRVCPTFYTAFYHDCEPLPLTC